MGVRIHLDKAAVKSRLIRQWDERTLPALSEQILEDCNRYCKEDTGTLIASSKLHSQPREGQLVWSTPYARRQYWEIPSASHDINPRAVWRWCQAAKQHHLSDWRALAQKLFRGG